MLPLEWRKSIFCTQNHVLCDKIFTSTVCMKRRTLLPTWMTMILRLLASRKPRITRTSSLRRWQRLNAERNARVTKLGVLSLSLSLCLSLSLSVSLSLPLSLPLSLSLSFSRARNISLYNKCAQILAGIDSSPPPPPLHAPY
jgi:hypothetical protein